MQTPNKDPDLPGETSAPRDSGGKRPAPHGDHATGLPDSDRHAAETLAGRLEDQGPAEHKTE